MSLQVSQSGTEGSGGAMIEAGASITRKPHQRIAERINLKPNHHGLAIVVPFGSLLNLTDVLTKKLRFDIYNPQDERSLKSYMQAVDLELKHHPIIVVVSGIRRDNLLLTDIGDINIKEDIMAPLFPPIATHLANNPKIFLFVSFSSKHHVFQFIEAIWENYIIGFISYLSDEIMRRVTGIWDELASSSMSVQNIFTSIHDQLPPTATMTVIDRLKEPIYLQSSYTSCHTTLAPSSAESDYVSHLDELLIDELLIDEQSFEYEISPISPSSTRRVE